MGPSKETIEDVFLSFLFGISRQPVGSDDTPAKFLSPEDGYGPVSTASIFRQFVKVALRQYDSPNWKKTWPKNWLGMKISSLAEHFADEEE